MQIGQMPLYEPFQRLLVSRVHIAVQKADRDRLEGAAPEPVTSSFSIDASSSATRTVPSARMRSRTSKLDARSTTGSGF